MRSPGMIGCIAWTMMAGCMDPSSVPQASGRDGVAVTIATDDKGQGEVRACVGSHDYPGCGRVRPSRDAFRICAQAGCESLDFAPSILQPGNASGFELGLFKAPIPVSASPEIEVVWARAGASDVHLRASLPEPFAITRPAPGKQLSEREPIEVEWEPAQSGDAMTLQLQGDCGGRTLSMDVEGEAAAELLRDTGAVAFAAERTAGCIVTLELRRTREGTGDPSAAASIVGEQVRTVTVEIVP